MSQQGWISHAVPAGTQGQGTRHTPGVKLTPPQLILQSLSSPGFSHGLQMPEHLKLWGFIPRELLEPQLCPCLQHV